MQNHTFENVKEKLVNCIMQYANIKDFKNIDVDTPFDEYNINSVDYIKIIVATEIEFEFEFDDNDLEVGRFNNLRNLIEYVLERKK